MCGIVGVIGRETENKEKIAREMAKIVTHRGPDDDGFFTDDYVGLGMRRLSIIDLEGGKQPMSSADGNLLIFFNGEIYNYKELRKELEEKGFIFKTKSDTEAILHIYESSGKAGLLKLRGMFAFCIYDKKSHTLFLARDFFGIKPLYYLKSGNSVLAFASEIKAILAHPGFKKEVNDEAIFNYLRFEYNPLEETCFKNIFSLKPGTCMTIDVAAKTFETEQFWKFTFETDENLGEEKAEEEIRGAMKDSVRHHMVSDVPVGSFLSGGVDSSIIATLMNDVISEEKPGTKNKTFTVGFKELSEGKDAKETADFLSTDHTEIKIGAEEYFSALPKLVWHFDEPVADPSAIALYFVAREARKKVKVVLSGEGADELFGGYNIYLAPFVAGRMRWLPNVFLKWLANLPFEFFGKNYLKRASSKLSDWYIGNASVFDKREVKKLWKGQKERFFSLDSLYSETKGSDPQTMQFIDIRTWLVGDILAKADKMTMANSLELRVPFLDTEVARVAKAIPDNLKWRGGQTKYTLRKAFSKIIPEGTRLRRKLGFPTPVRYWLNKDATAIYDVIRDSSYIKSRMNMDEVQNVILKHTSGKKDWSRKIYLLYILALWHSVFFEGGLNSA